MIVLFHTRDNVMQAVEIHDVLLEIYDQHMISHVVNRFLAFGRILVHTLATFLISRDPSAECAQFIS